MSSTSSTGLQIQPIRYKNWIITTKVIDRRLWLRWQHPKENFPRYSYPVTERGLADTIRYARFLIDLAIQLEAAASAQELPSSDSCEF